MRVECPTQRRPEWRNGIVIIISKFRHDLESDPHLGRRLESRKGGIRCSETVQSMEESHVVWVYEKGF